MTELERAKAILLRVLAFHGRTEAQLRARLERSGLGEQADEVLAWLRRLGYVDDAAYARARARALLAPGRLGPRLAERRLLAAGVAPELAAAAVRAAAEEAGGRELPRRGAPRGSGREDPSPAAAKRQADEPAAERLGGSGGCERPPEPDELSLARAAAARKLRGAAPAELDERARARLARFLLGRGFSPAAVAAAAGLRDPPDAA